MSPPAELDGERATVPRRADLKARIAEVFHPGSATKPAVFVLGPLEQRQVVKDVRPLHPVLRMLYGRRVLAREERALSALAGSAGTPRLLGRIDRDAFSMEYRPGVPLRGSLQGPDPAKFRRACLDLERKVCELHERGVVHLDLRQRRNILVDVDGSVSLIDFESALRLGHRGLKGLIFRLLAPLDRSAVLKFKARYAADLLDQAEHAKLRRIRRLRSLWVFHHLGGVLRRLLGRSSRSDETDSE